MRELVMAMAMLAAAPGVGSAMTDVEKKLCLVAAAGKLPALPGGIITNAVVDDGAQAAARAVERYSLLGAARDMQQLYDAGLFPKEDPKARPKAEDRGKMIQAAFDGQKSQSGMAEITIKAGVIEATYAIACFGVSGRMFVQPDGLVR